MGRFRRSWELAKSSWGVIRSRPELIALPIVSFIAVAIVGAGFAVPIFVAGSGTSDGSTMSPLLWIVAFIGYLIITYVILFFNTALICAANEYFDGGSPSLGSALADAAQRAGKILPWAIVSATVSVVIRSLQERFGIVGRLVLGLVGMAWALVTFLVLPLIALEGLGTGAAIKRSAQMFKSTWGENVIANAGIGLVGFLAIACGPLLALVATGSGPLIVAGVGLFILWVLVVSVVTSAMTVVFQTALYRYASQGHVPEAFGSADLPGAFAPKGRRGRPALG